MFTRIKRERVFGLVVVAPALFLGVAMAAVVFLVTDILYQEITATVTTIGLVALVGWFWFALPFARRRRGEQPP